MRNKNSLFAFLFCLIVATVCSEPGTTKIDFTPAEIAGSLPISRPEDQGLDSGRLAEAYAHAMQVRRLRSLLVVRNGHLVAEKYFGLASPRADNIYSATKSVVSALVGIALREGNINSLEQKAVEFLPEYFPTDADPRKAEITIEHLLTMRSGLEPTRGRDWRTAVDPLQLVLGRQQLADPGRRYSYSSGDTHLLSAILTKASGMSTAEFAERYLFAPLGIKHYLWQRDQQGLFLGNAGLHLEPRDLAKFGLLYLNNGSYDGQQVLPEGWPARSTAVHVSFPLRSRLRGYGYLWWLYRSAGYDVNCAVGAGGQLVMVVPALSMVVVSTSADGSVHEALRLLKLHILPAVQDVEAPISSVRKIAAFVVGVQLATLAWRIYWKLKASTAERPSVSDLPPVDKLIVVALIVAAVGVFVLPGINTGLSAFATARLALWLSVLLFAGYPFALVGHYELFVPRERRSYRPRPRQEKIAIALILIIVLLYLIRVVAGQLEWLADVDYVFDLFDGYEHYSRQQGGWQYKDIGWLAIVPALLGVWAARLHWAWLTWPGKFALLGVLLATALGLARLWRYLRGGVKASPQIPGWVPVLVFATAPVAVGAGMTLQESTFPTINHYIDQPINRVIDVVAPSVAGPVIALAAVGCLTVFVWRRKRLTTASLLAKAALMGPLTLLMIATLWTGILWARWNVIVVRHIYLRWNWFGVTLPNPEPLVIVVGGIWTGALIAIVVYLAHKRVAVPGQESEQERGPQ